MPNDLAERARHLLALHHADSPLVLPNAWDAASARAVALAGFPAVATTSGGVAASLGHADHQQSPPDLVFEAIRRISAVVDLPVTADVEAGYGLAPGELVERLLAAGAVGCNLEDSDHTAGGLADADRHAAYLAEVRAAAGRAGVALVLNARIDVYLHGDAGPEARFDEALRRARLYLGAGADAVYPIFARGRDALRGFAEALEAPVNAMVTPGGLSVGELAGLGIRRISYGTMLFRGADAWLRERLAEIREEL
jgi:2-methylisocitrate lyase-like PEP mutase family enzyme